jgi:hypothetical protein
VEKSKPFLILFLAKIYACSESLYLFAEAGKSSFSADADENDTRAQKNEVFFQNITKTTYLYIKKH